MKNNQKQQLKSAGVLGIIGLLGLCLAIIATPWNRMVQDPTLEAAKQKAEVVGYQVVQIYREAALSGAASGVRLGRGPASAGSNGSEISMDNIRSVGAMGQDPWGEPYRYRILSGDNSGKMRILVWSGGPNKRTETPKLDDDEALVDGQPAYSGDDLGVLLVMSHN